jgi:hypothetical protein
MQNTRFVTLAAFAFVPMALFVACSSESESGTVSSGTTSTTSTTGAGGSSSASTTVATTTAATTTSSTGSGMITCDDAYSNITPGECDLLQQDCGPGKTCKPTGSGADWTTSCKVANGLKGPAESCQDDSECKAGLLCFDKCLAICCPGSDEPCGGGTCNLQVSWNDTEFFTMVCSYAAACTLFQPNACANGDECHIQDPSQGLTTCLPPSPTQVDEGQDCNFINDCKDMQYCFSQNGEQGVCRYNCDLTAAAGTAPGLGGCPASQTCQPNYDFGIPNVSVCLP